MTAQQKGVNFKTRDPRKRFYTKAQVKKEGRRLAMYANRSRIKQPLDGPLIFEAIFVHPMTKKLARQHIGSLSNPHFILPHAEIPDADNSSKLLLDVLTQAGFWHDDKQVCDLILRKRWGSFPRIEVTIQQYRE